METVGNFFFDAELQRYGGKLAILGNLNPKDMHSVKKVSDPFVKESLEIWSEISFEETVTSDKHLRSLPLWHNSLIKIGNKPVFYQDWFLKGISKVNQLKDDSFNFLSHTSFQNKYNLRVKPLTFFWNDRSNPPSKLQETSRTATRASHRL